MTPEAANKRSFQRRLEGLTSIRSSFGPKETAERLRNEIRARGMIIFARIDHAAGATSVGLSLPPTELIIFGNARGGTPLMQFAQTVGIDLPLKALVWEDSHGTTWISYNEPSWIAQRHQLGANAQPIVNMAAALGGMSRKAAGA